MSNTRGGFTVVSPELLRGYESNTIDTGHIPPPVTSRETKGGNRGIEQNTARGVKEAPVITGITPVTYGPTSDAPIVDPFKTYGDY